MSLRCSLKASVPGLTACGANAPMSVFALMVFTMYAVLWLYCCRLECPTMMRGVLAAQVRGDGNTRDSRARGIAMASTALIPTAATGSTQAGALRQAWGISGQRLSKLGAAKEQVRFDSVCGFTAHEKRPITAKIPHWLQAAHVWALRSVRGRLIFRQKFEKIRFTN